MTSHVLSTCSRTGFSWLSPRGGNAFSSVFLRDLNHGSCTEEIPLFPLAAPEFTAVNWVFFLCLLPGAIIQRVLEVTVTPTFICSVTLSLIHSCSHALDEHNYKGCKSPGYYIDITKTITIQFWLNSSSTHKTNQYMIDLFTSEL